MDIFEKLPYELIVMIIQEIGDFVGIESLLACSPWVNAVFRDRPRRQLLDIIAANPMTQVPDIQELFRNVLLIRCTHCQSFEEYQQRCRNMPSVLLEYIACSEVYDAIRLAARIQRLACLCLSMMQRNFVFAISFTPQLRSIVSSLSPEACRIQAAKRPFSWIEEYRVYWSLWHIQHHSDLQAAAHGRWHWSPDSKRNIAEYINWAHTFISDIEDRRLLNEQIWAILAVLMDYWTPPMYETDPPQAGWECDPVLQTPWVFRVSISALLARPTNGYPIWSAPSVPEEMDTETAWGRTLQLRNRPTRFTKMLAEHGMVASYHGAWELSNLRPYRRLGVVFWDQWRMYSVGISYDDRLSKPTPGGGFIHGNPMSISMSAYNLWSVWLALVGKRLPPWSIKGKPMHLIRGDSDIELLTFENMPEAMIDRNTR